jgi:glycosyltransferase involved in cell wall biosynthesis
MGTPVIAYNVNGLRDSVIHGTNGLLVQSNTPESLAESALEVLTDRNVLENLSNKALEHSKQFSWDKTTDHILTQIEKMT